MIFGGTEKFHGQIDPVRSKLASSSVLPRKNIHNISLHLRGRMKLYQSGILGLSLLLPCAALADFQYQETTQITGGSALSLMKMAGHFSRQARDAGLPIVSTVYVQGNRMARVDAETIEIIDLDKETITHVDLQKHTYTEMTFEQLRQQMEKAVQQAQTKQAEQKPAQTSQQPPSDVDLKFTVNVRNTSTTKQISGVTANESILTMQMEGTDKTNGQKGAFAMTNDMWLAPEIPGYQELREFNEKAAIKMGSIFSGSGMSSLLPAMQPGMSQGMADMAKEVSKLKGIPIQQIMRMGVTANGAPLPAASEAPLPPESSDPQMPSAGDVAQNSAASALTSRLGALGGFGGFGHKKKQVPPPDDAANDQTDPQAQNASVLMESQTQLTSFSSSPIDMSKFIVPAGFRRVEMQQMK
jgi:hypothetical protein